MPILTSSAQRFQTFLVYVTKSQSSLKVLRLPRGDARLRLRIVNAETSRRNRQVLVKEVCGKGWRYIIYKVHSLIDY